LERLGDSSLLYVNVSAGISTLNVKVEGSANTAVGERLTLRLMPEQLHLFDVAGKACERPIVLPS
jgi:multiple sugar transport system ATP-binding protein